MDRSGADAETEGNNHQSTDYPNFTVHNNPLIDGDSSRKQGHRIAPHLTRNHFYKSIFGLIYRMGFLTPDGVADCLI